MGKPPWKTQVSPLKGEAPAGDPGGGENSERNFTLKLLPPPEFLSWQSAEAGLALPGGSLGGEGIDVMWNLTIRPTTAFLTAFRPGHQPNTNYIL